MDESLSEVYVVVWADAWHDRDETTPEDWLPSYLCTTVGFLVRDEAAVLSLASEVLPDAQYRSVTHIPRCLVTSTTKLSKGAAHDGHNSARAGG